MSDTDKQLEPFEADALETSRRLRDVAEVVRLRGLDGAAAICERGSRLIWEMVHDKVKNR
jgi:hypothetical protein